MGSLRGLLGTPEVSPTDSIPTGFGSQKVWGLIFLALEPWAGLELLTPKIYRPNFYPPHVGVGPAHSMSPSFLPVWMGVVSLIP